MINLKSLTVKNFMSVGGITQALNLDQNGLTLILGKNGDPGGDSNGVGKSTLVNAISYALFGQALTNIKRDNLINNINNKNMVVSLDFEIDGTNYRIERGRKPTYTKWIVEGGVVAAPDQDESQGESKWTQTEIERTIGFSHAVFKHIIALTTRTEPFLSMRANDQRIVIEELLGVTQLSAKADTLKELIRDTKDKIKEEEIRIRTLQESNQRYQNMINDLQRKSILWETQKQKDQKRIEENISILENIDIEKEIENQKLLAIFKELKKEIFNSEKHKNNLLKNLQNWQKQILELESNLEQLANHECPMCGQQTHDIKTTDIIESMTGKLRDLELKSEEVANEYTKHETEFNELIQTYESLGPEPEKLYYKNLEEALNHQSKLKSLNRDMEQLDNNKNTYEDQIESLTSSGLQTINHDNLNELNKFWSHQDYILRMLTNKDSPIRKKIIDQNLAYLNHRLAHYLEKLNLPHTVKFLNDLSVEIMFLGRDFDFEQLSAGERNRLILSLAWSFRDIWESLNKPINLLFIDELIDSGMDQSGIESALEILKKIYRERNKNIFLISHRDELTSRVNNVLIVKKEDGYTTFDIDGASETENAA